MSTFITREDGYFALTKPGYIAQEVSGKAACICRYRPGTGFHHLLYQI